MDYKRQESIWYPFHRGFFDYTKIRTNRRQYWTTLLMSILMLLAFIVLYFTVFLYYCYIDIRFG